MAPRLSVVVVTWNSAADIELCLTRLETCTTTPFEVIVVDNASGDATREVVSAFAAERRPDTWRLIANDANTGYTRAANQGFRAARGDLVVFLNPDTAVSRGWDGELERALAPGVGAVGPISNHAAGRQFFERWVEESPTPPSLQDLMEGAGRCSAPPEAVKLLMGFCLMVRRATLEAHGLFDESLVLGGDDLEYSLRLRRAGLELRVVPSCFVWHRGQASFGHHPADAVENFRQEGVDGVYRILKEWYGAEQVPPPMELWGINWFRPTELDAGRRDLVSIVIPVHNGLADTLACLDSVARFTPEAHEILVVDNGSTDDTAAALERRGGVTLIRHEENRGFAGGVNAGIRAARGTSVLLLNNDTLVTPGWLASLREGLRSRPRAGLVGAVSNYAGCDQQVPVTYTDRADAAAFGEAWNRARGAEFESVSLLSGLCLLVKREVFDVIGLFDERFTIGNYEDNDFCLRARLANFDLVLARGAFVHHEGNRTFNAMGVNYREISDRNQALFLEKWGMGGGATSAPAEPGAFPEPESRLWSAIEELGPAVLDEAAPVAERRAAAETLIGLATEAGRADIAGEFEQALGRFAAEGWPEVLPEAGRTLVLGATTAPLVAAFEKGLRVTAIEFDPAVVARHLDRHPALPVIHARFSRLPAPDGVFDRVLFARPPDTFEDPATLLREARRVSGELLAADGSPLCAEAVRVFLAAGTPSRSGTEARATGEDGSRCPIPSTGAPGDPEAADLFFGTTPGPDPAHVERLADEAALRGGHALVVAADPEPWIEALEARGMTAQGASEPSGWAEDLFDLALIPAWERFAAPQDQLVALLGVTKPGATILVGAPDDSGSSDLRLASLPRRRFSPASLHAELALYGREIRLPGTDGPAQGGRLLATFVNEKRMDPARDFPVERSLLSADDRAGLADLQPGRGAVVLAAAVFDPPGGGAEISARRIVEDLAREREVHVVTMGSLNTSRRLGPFLVHEAFDAGRFHDLVVMLKPDVVLTQLEMAPTAIDAARAAGARSILFVRSYEPLCPEPRALAQCDRNCAACPHYLAERETTDTQRRAIREADRVVTNSRFLRQVLRDLTGVDAVVAYPPVAVPAADPGAAPERSPNGCAGESGPTPAENARGNGTIALVKPAPYKGLGVFLALAGRMPEREFLLVGGRPPVPLPANVVVRDWVEPERVLDGVRLLLVPSQWPEPFGRVVVEALGRGIPVLASRTGGLPEAGGDAARYVDDFADPAAWESAVRALLDDPGLEAEIRLTGPAWAARFREDTTVIDLVNATIADVSRPGRTAGEVMASGPSPRPVRRPGSGSPGRVHWEGPFFETHSFAHMNRELAAALLDLDVPVVPVNRGRRQDLHDDPAGLRVASAMAASTPGVPDLTVRCAWPPRFHRPETGKLVLNVPWEFGSVPASWVRAADRNAEELWAISDYVRASWIRGGFDPARIVTVPLGVRTDLYHEGVPAASLPTESSFRFLWIGGATPRKGLDILLAAWERAFTSEDDVCLVLKDVALYGGQVAEAVEKFRGRPGAPEILHISDDVPPGAMPSLYRACHAYVAPYRGEGYGLPIAEAMSAGLPVIVTGHGGAMQFAHPGIAGILPARIVPWGCDGIGGYGTMGMPYLAEPSADDVAEAMRTLHRNGRAALDLGRRGAEAIRQGHTWHHTALAARARIAALLDAAEFTLERAG